MLVGSVFPLGLCHCYLNTTVGSQGGVDYIVPFQSKITGVVTRRPLWFGSSQDNRCL